MSSTRTRGAAARTVSRRGPRASRRRHDIFKAFQGCIIDNGYSRTTLADVAHRAGMSASHLLYYFKSKDAILEEYFESVAVRTLRRIEGFGQEPPARQVELLADFWFRDEAGARLQIGFMLECFGVAVHHEALKRTKSDFDSRLKRHLSRVFALAPRLRPGSTGDAAEIALSLMIGLRAAVYFDGNLALADARRLFVDILRRMCGLAGPAASAAPAPGSGPAAA